MGACPGRGVRGKFMLLGCYHRALHRAEPEPEHWIRFDHSGERRGWCCRAVAIAVMCTSGGAAQLRFPGSRRTALRGREDCRAILVTNSVLDISLRIRRSLRVAKCWWVFYSCVFGENEKKMGGRREEESRSPCRGLFYFCVFEPSHPPPATRRLS
jgi:hypothetical protein